YTGFTFHQYVMKKKLIYAKHLLREYRSSSAVYSKSGFSSYPHFLKAFKREFGITPKEFLKRDTQKQLVHYEHFEDEQ
ncbi:helix-turn-helix domain-containing protein, partial [Enterococcus faecium]